MLVVATESLSQVSEKENFRVHMKNNADKILPQKGEEYTLSDPKEVKNCDALTFNKTKMIPIFRGVKNINVHLIFPRGDEHDTRCHYVTENCSEQQKTKAERAYADFPEVLHSDNIIQVISEQVMRDFAPVTTGGCIPFTILNPLIPRTRPKMSYPNGLEICGSDTFIDDRLKDPASLTFSIEVNFLGSDYPASFSSAKVATLPDRRIAVITWKPVRKDCFQDYMARKPEVTAYIPFNLTPKEITEKFRKFMLGVKIISEELQKTSGNLYSFNCEANLTTR